MPPPPQEFKIRRMNRSPADHPYLRALRFVLRKINPNRPETANAHITFAFSGPALPAGETSCAEVAVVVIVRVELAWELFRLIWAGENEQDALDGSPEHCREICPAYVPIAAASMVKVADWPARMVAEAGTEETV